jgi:hypothetical protein
MKQKTKKTSAVKAENKNIVAGVPAATKSEAGRAARCDDMYLRHITLSGESRCCFKVQTERCHDGTQIPEPIELVICPPITDLDCDQGCNLSMAEARMLRDAFDGAIAFVEGNSIENAVPRRIEKLCNDGTMSTEQTVKLCAWSAAEDGHEVTIDVSTFDSDNGCLPHKIEYSVMRNGKDAGEGAFELSHADMRKFRVVIDRAVEFFEASSVPAGNSAPTPASVPAGGDGVTVPRSMAGMLWDLLFDCMESDCLSDGAVDYVGRYCSCLNCAARREGLTDASYDEEIIKYAGLIYELAGRMGVKGLPEPRAYVWEVRMKCEVADKSEKGEHAE